MVQKTKPRRTKADLDIFVTLPEKLLLWRRRNKITQEKAAKQFKVPSFDYKLMEYGQLQLPKHIIHRTFDEFEWKYLFAHEQCFLYRRRCKMTQAQVALEMGICRDWMRQMETGKIDCTALCNYWES
jgi:DNA-binding XRE family transcriptional regulator